MFIYLGMQMAARGRGRGRGMGANDPITVEELMQTQNEMMHVFMQHLQQQPPPPPPPVHVRDKRGEFMKRRPLVFVTDILSEVISSPWILLREIYPNYDVPHDRLRDITHDYARTRGDRFHLRDITHNSSWARVYLGREFPLPPTCINTRDQ